jgi:2-polyprenyl-3-methyl-5-hydroxy-6-metoxy-1,4-benzoquinol methylase
MSSGSHSLTSKAFWEETYLAEVVLPCRVRRDMPTERALAQALEQEATVEPGAHLLEVGCAPGRWMVFYAERFGAHVEGIEYAEGAAALTERNLAACGVEGRVHRADFWDFQSARTYDLVLSLGFIEHFSNPEEVFRRHAAFVAQRGLLALGVPNFRGVTAFLQRLFDPTWLALHNLEAVHGDVFLAAARELRLALRADRFLGGFDPDMISTRKRGRPVLAPFWHLRHRGFGDRLNAAWLSAYRLMVFERTAD